MGRERIVILGYDAVSPLGTEPADQWERAARGESGVGPLTRFALPSGFPVAIAGQVPDFDAGAYAFLSPRAMALWPSPIYRHGLLVVHRALEKSGMIITPEIAHRVAVTFSTAVGGQDTLIAADRRMTAEGKWPPPCANPNSCINMIGGKVSILTGATGPIVSTVTACATGLTSVLMAALLMDQGRADAAICGAVDFPLVPPIVAGFATMNGAYQEKPEARSEPPAAASRPFSAHRRGFVISEGAGAVIVATERFARDHGLKPRFAIAGWSMTADAHHFVAPRLETVRRCIAESLADAGVRPGDIDAVNAHGTSTKIGDKVEHEALQSVFEGRIPPVSANKSQMGHAMGAASAIEMILAMEGMAKGQLLPTLNYRPDDQLPMDAVAEGTRRLDQTLVLKNAFGFGGCNACAVIERIE